MPSADSELIINRFRVGCTHLRNRFRWPEQSATSLGFQTLYLADLDAIAGSPPRLDIYRELIAAQFHLWVDAGVRDPATVAPLLELDPAFTTIVAGLETMAGPRELAEIVRIGGSGSGRIQSRLIRGTPPDGRLGSLGDREIPLIWLWRRLIAACTAC